MFAAQVSLIVSCPNYSFSWNIDPILQDLYQYSRLNHPEQCTSYIGGVLGPYFSCYATWWKKTTFVFVCHPPLRCVKMEPDFGQLIKPGIISGQLTPDDHPTASFWSNPIKTKTKMSEGKLSAVWDGCIADTVVKTGSGHFILILGLSTIFRPMFISVAPKLGKFIKNLMANKPGYFQI